MPVYDTIAMLDGDSSSERVNKPRERQLSNIACTLEQFLLVDGDADEPFHCPVPSAAFRDEGAGKVAIVRLCSLCSPFHCSHPVSCGQKSREERFIIYVHAKSCHRSEFTFSHFHLSYRVVVTTTADQQLEHTKSNKELCQQISHKSICGFSQEKSASLVSLI